jgi:hypothetical protein
MCLPVIGFSKIPSVVVCTIACVPSSISNSLRIFLGITTWPFIVKETVSLFVEFFICKEYAVCSCVSQRLFFLQIDFVAPERKVVRARGAATLPRVRAVRF